jgi:hypothetical protein
MTNEYMGTMGMVANGVGDNIRWCTGLSVTTQMHKQLFCVWGIR